MKKIIVAILFTLAPVASATFLPGPIQISTGTGGLNNVGYAANNSSAPVSIQNATLAVTQSGNFNLNNSTVGVVYGGAAGTQIPVQIQNSTMTVNANETLLVSSNTAVPTGVADAGNVRTMADTYGRLITLPIATRSLVQVATATLTTTTSETIFISSTSAKFVRLIGCIGENTSATAADITIRLNGGPTANNTGSFKLGMSVSNVPVGFFPPGGIVAQLANANTTIQASASVTSLHLSCWYMTE